MRHNTYNYEYIEKGYECLECGYKSKGMFVCRRSWICYRCLIGDEVKEREIMSREHECRELQQRNAEYEHRIEIERNTSGEWNIERVHGRYAKYERVLRDISGCPFCLEELK